MTESPLTLEYATTHDRRRRKRITLLEIGLMAGLLLLLAAIALPAFLTTSCGSPKTFVVGLIRPNGGISQAIEVYEDNTGRLPLTLDALVRRPAELPRDMAWAGPYLCDVQILVDPWGNPFRYDPTAPRGGGHFDLWSLGPNGVDESSDNDGDNGDDICNWK